MDCFAMSLRRPFGRSLINSFAALHFDACVNIYKFGHTDDCADFSEIVRNRLNRMKSTQ